MTHGPRTILYLTPWAQAGGGQESLLLLIKGLDRARFRPVLVVPAEGEVAERARALDCKVIVLELPPLRSLWSVPSAVFALKKIIGDESVALIHAEQPRAVVYCALARAAQPLVWHVRASCRDALDPLLERMADRIILVADALAFRFSEKGKLVTIRNGVEAERPDAPAGPLPVKKAPAILCAGRLEHDKGQHLLVEALRSLPNAEVWLAGRAEGGYAESLRRTAGGLNVRFLGHRSDLRAVMAAADIVALCSSHEAFPRVLIEAMAEGRPVVASRVGGVPEAVEDGKTGLLVPPGDAPALAAALSRLLSDEALRRSMGEAGLRRAAEFSAERTTRAVEGVYSDLLRL